MAVSVAGALAAADVAYTWDRTYDVPLPGISARAEADAGALYEFYMSLPPGERADRGSEVQEGLTRIGVNWSLIPAEGDLGRTCRGSRRFVPL